MVEDEEERSRESGKGGRVKIQEEEVKEEGGREGRE